MCMLFIFNKSIDFTKSIDFYLNHIKVKSLPDWGSFLGDYIYIAIKIIDSDFCSQI